MSGSGKRKREDGVDDTLVAPPPDASSSSKATASVSSSGAFTAIHPPATLIVSSVPGLSPHTDNPPQHTAATGATATPSSISSSTDPVSATTTTPPTSAWQPRHVSLYKKTEKLTLIGEGTYGSVFLARDPTGELVALKKIRKEKKEGFPITAIREIKILKRVDHVNIVRLKDVVSSHTYIPSSGSDSGVGTGSRQFKEGDVFMIFEFCDHDLTGLLESRVTLTLPQLTYYLYSILQGLYYLHRHKIIHRDIKGANILISNNGAVKIADFGLARIMTRGGYTNRVVTLWYRAPELLLGMSEYDAKIDIWAVGCLFAELLCKGAVLFPGNNSDLDQLHRIYEYCGTPDEKTWPAVTKLKYYAQFTPEKRERRLRPLFESRMRSGNYGSLITAKAIDLLDRMLQLNPAERISAKDALDHDFFYEEGKGLRMMRRDEHPKYGQNYHEYHSKRRRKNREEQMRHGGGGGAGGGGAGAGGAGEREGERGGGGGGGGVGGVGVGRGGAAAGSVAAGPAAGAGTGGSHRGPMSAAAGGGNALAGGPAGGGTGGPTGGGHQARGGANAHPARPPPGGGGYANKPRG